MKTVFKYPLALGGYTHLDLPSGAEPLRVESVSGQLFMWALVDSERPTEKRIFRIFGTGEGIGEQRVKYIDGAMMDNFFQWHLFEVFG